MAEGTAEKEEYQVLLSADYAIDTDKLNIVLKEKFGKRESKSKHAALTGEYGWRDLGYFRNLTHVADYIVKHELMKEHEIGELRDIAERIEAVRDDIVDHITERITITKA
ncbi:hypothetical protein [Bacillus sp. FJAT-22090]|uniref:hypothetical protein n=1 Tax=Bacillus sp. FJAT-22090 TaxID=1581038 RepID=UPI0011A42A3F|nr:hypothetical protein [Bacillus sp. FJAT-22090]